MRISENLQVFIMHSTFAFGVYLIVWVLLASKINYRKLFKASLALYITLIVYTFAFSMLRNIIDPQIHFTISQVNGPIMIGGIVGHSAHSVHGLVTNRIKGRLRIISTLLIALNLIFLLAFFTISLFVSSSNI